MLGVYRFNMKSLCLSCPFNSNVITIYAITELIMDFEEMICVQFGQRI